MFLNSAKELMQRTVPKNLELCWIIDAFELWCWRRLLKVPWTARRSNQSVLKEIRLEYSLEGLMLKLKFQYFSHLMRRTDSLRKTLMLGKIEGGGEEQQEKETTQGEMVGWHLQLNGHEFEQAPGVGDGQGSLACCSPWSCRVRQSSSTVEQSIMHVIGLQCRRCGFDLWVGNIPWRREWQPTPVFLPGESHGQRGLVGYSPWGREESDMTAWL